MFCGNAADDAADIHHLARKAKIVVLPRCAVRHIQRTLCFPQLAAFFHAAHDDRGADPVEVHRGGPILAIRFVVKPVLGPLELV